MLIACEYQPGLYLDRMAAVAAVNPETTDPLALEAARCRAMIARATIPNECGPDIAPSPARKGFVLHHNVELLPVGTKGVEAVHRGYGGRAAIRRADAFDAMLAAAARAKREWPLTPGQISIGRRYHDLVELLSADGTKLSQLQGSFGSGDSGNWMDQRLVLSREVEGMRRRIGIGPVIVLRRIRPSQRNRKLGKDEVAPLMFTSRDLIDAVCLKEKSIRETLQMFNWQDNGRNCKVALEALRSALDRMIGYFPKKSS